VGFLVREESDETLKVSLRSKTNVDVSAIAKRFGGGGHIRAAGFVIGGMERDVLIEKLLKMIEGEMKL